MINSPMLETERTNIRKLTLDDAPFILALVNSPGWLQYIGDRNIHDRQTAETYLATRYIKLYQHTGFSYYLAETKADKPLGICGFLQRPDLDHVDLGFAFAPDYHGQGFGFEVGRAVLDYGISHFGFKIVDAVTSVENPPSIGLLQKLGFQAHGFIEYPQHSRSRLFRYQANRV